LRENILTGFLYASELSEVSFFLSRFVTDSDCFSAKRSVVKLNCSLTASSFEIKLAFFSLQDRQTMLDRQLSLHMITPATLSNSHTLSNSASAVE
jgi:hypothetical protein